jgi:CheY-like chemotaxis protein
MPDLAAHLVRSGVLPPREAARALAAARDGDVASSVLRLGIAQEAALAKALADHHGCPAVDFSKSVVPTSNVEVVAPAFCREHRCLPVSISRSELVLAMAEPQDQPLADEVRFVTGRSVLRYAAVAAAIERTLGAVVRERGRGAPTWRGQHAPVLPDPGAAWVGVVHGADRADGVALLEATSSMALAAVPENLETTPFSVPSPARPQRPTELARRPVPPPPGGPEASARLVGPGAGKLALVADAAPELREQAAALLGTLGCTVLQAAKGGPALDIVREARPELVLLDAMLPMTPGFEVCRAVKGDPVLRPTAVILTCAVQRATAAADVKAAFGADAFLEKPYRDDEVLRTAKLLLLGQVEDPTEEAAREAARITWREGARLLQAGRVEEATAFLRDAVGKDDFSAEAQYYLGVALAWQGLLFEAAAAFARAAELRPDVDAAHQLLARAYEQLGLTKAARGAWAQAIETCRDERRRPEMQARLMRLLGT